MTLTFSLPVSLEAGAVRLMRLHQGKPVQDFSSWVRLTTIVESGKTRVTVRFRSRRPGLRLPTGKYALLIQNDLVRGLGTDLPLRTSSGAETTELPFLTWA
jgi:hypothetical protein